MVLLSTIGATGTLAQSPATPGVADQTLALRADSGPRDADCRGRAVTIEGNGGEVTLHGGCRALTLLGDGVTVHAEMAPASRIDVAGNGDQVDWFLRQPGPDPVASVSGQGSRIYRQQRLGSVVTPLTDAAARPDLAPTLAIAVTGQKRDADCTGRDVTLTGSDDTVVLRGGCRSLTVLGDNDRVQAELMPGTRVRIAGSRSVVAFALIGTGPDPIVSVNGAASDAWRVQRLGATSRADADAGVAPTARGMHVQGPGAVVSQMPKVAQPLVDSGPPGLPGSPSTPP